MTGYHGKGDQTVEFVRPDMPTTALVTSGPFTHARNPAYQGGSLALLGLALVLGSDWIVLLMVPALLPADRLACHRAGPKVRNRALEYGLVSMSNEATATARTSALVSCVTSPSWGSSTFQVD